jgi:hypothetical protein
MVDERESPSAGWHEVYDEMAAGTNVEAATHPCPDCDRTCGNVLRDVYACETHGVFRASVDADRPEETESSDAEQPSGSRSEDSDEMTNRQTRRAD